MSKPIIVANNLSKSFNSGSYSEALKDINLEIKSGEFCSITGPSGSGKSTLLHILGCLDTPSVGDLYIKENLISKFNDAQLTEFRKKHIGFIFQFHFLLPELTAFENLVVPQLLNKVKPDKAKQKAEELLSKVRILNKRNNRPSQMSGGEQQRVAIARSMVNNPSIILADEPTGNLDTENSKNIFEILKELNEEGQTIVVVTHDLTFAQKCNRIIKIVDGKIIPQE